jgi:chromodomain-helicase-DNA-binding protein 1
MLTSLSFFFKTVQTVAFLSYLFHERHQYGPFLVIVPLSTITAWQTQFDAWAPDLNVITYIGNAAAREVIRTYEFGPSSKKPKMNVLLTTYELTLRDAKELSDIKWMVLTVDEVRFGLFIACLTFFSDEGSHRHTG